MIILEPLTVIALMIVPIVCVIIIKCNVVSLYDLISTGLNHDNTLEAIATSVVLGTLLYLLYLTVPMVLKSLVYGCL